MKPTFPGAQTNIRISRPSMATENKEGSANSNVVENENFSEAITEVKSDEMENEVSQRAKIPVLTQLEKSLGVQQQVRIDHENRKREEPQQTSVLKKLFNNVASKKAVDTEESQSAQLVATRDGSIEDRNKIELSGTTNQSAQIVVEPLANPHTIAQLKETKVKTDANFNIQKSRGAVLHEAMLIPTKTSLVLPEAVGNQAVKYPLQDVAEKIQKVSVMSRGVVGDHEKTYDRHKNQVRQVQSLQNTTSIAVVLNRQEKHFPVDVVSHAWHQISQKISQTLGNPGQHRDVPTSFLSPQPELPVSVAKIVKQLQIQLKPESLGTVSVKLMLNEGYLEVTLSSSDRHLAARLHQNSSQLSQQLRASGFAFDSLSIRISEAEGLSGVRMQNTPLQNETSQLFYDERGSHHSMQGSFPSGQSDRQTDEKVPGAQQENDNGETVLENTHNIGNSCGAVYL